MCTYKFYASTVERFSLPAPTTPLVISSLYSSYHAETWSITTIIRYIVESNILYHLQTLRTQTLYSCHNTIVSATICRIICQMHPQENTYVLYALNAYSALHSSVTTR